MRRTVLKTLLVVGSVWASAIATPALAGGPAKALAAVRQGAREGPQYPGDRGPRRAGRSARNAHRGDQERTRRALPEHERDHDRTDDTEVQLSLGADVEQVHAERRRSG